MSSGITNFCTIALIVTSTCLAESTQPLSLVNLMHKFFGTNSPTEPSTYRELSGRSSSVDMETYLAEIDGDRVGRTTDMPTTSTANGSILGPCGEHHFMCTAHMHDYETKGHLVCLPNKWRCDNVADCPDSSVGELDVISVIFQDEQTCGTPSVGCASNHIVCDNGKCVPASLRCNQFDDCGDLTDERDCAEAVGIEREMETSAVRVKCDTRTHFECHMGQCISMDARCDGFQDCPGGDDEQGCPSDMSQQCLSHQFKCVSFSTCIEQSWVCDGMNDCTDSSDEAHCRNGEVVPSLDDYEAGAVTCKPDEFSCTSGAVNCIGRKSVCDGLSDCDDHSDEGSFCGDCQNHGCHERCEDSPIGPSCSCLHGHVLNADGVSCDDVDECATGVDGCEHECVNTEGAYHCACAAGFSLDSITQKKCKLIDTNSGTIMVLLTHAMNMIPLFPGSAKGHESMSLHSSGFVNSMAVRRDLVSNQQHSHFAHLAHDGTGPAPLQHVSVNGDTDRSMVFFSTRSSGGRSGRVYVITNRQAVCALDNVVGVTAVVVDANTGNLYYTQGSPATHTAIGVCDPSLRFCRTLLVDDDMHRLRDLAVHNALGRIYYAHTTASHETFISSMSMDGTDVRVVAHGKLHSPTVLTMHEASNTLYWFDADMLMIERVHVLTGRREVVATHGIHNIAAMEVFDGRIVWVDRDTSSLVSTSITNPTDRKTLDVFVSPPQAMAIQHAAHTPITQPDTNPCSTARCGHLCLTRPVNTTDVHGEWFIRLEAVCHCPNGYSWHPVLGSCRPSGKLVDQQPSMCDEMVSARCEHDAMCFNGGVCDRHARAQVCICPLGYEGLYCEIDLYPLRTRSGGLLVIIALMFVLILLAVGFFLYARRQRQLHRDIMPDSLKKATDPMVKHVRRGVDQVKMRYSSVSSMMDTSIVSVAAGDITRTINEIERGCPNLSYEEGVEIGVATDEKMPLVKAEVGVDVCAPDYGSQSQIV